MDSRELTYRIQGCIFEVSRHLGSGFLEKVYQQSLLKELQRAGLQAVAEKPISVFYKGEVVGDYRADIIVNDTSVTGNKSAGQLAGNGCAAIAELSKSNRVKDRLIGKLHAPESNR